jgi:hypothetical protein
MAARLLADHGPGAQVHRKTKAHRSRTAAEKSDEDPEWCWSGNAAADTAAKERIKGQLVDANMAKELAEAKFHAERWLQHLGVLSTLARS